MRSATGKEMAAELFEVMIVGRKVNAAKRRAAGRRIGANIRRLQRVRSTRTAEQALAQARGEYLTRSRPKFSRAR